METIKSGIPRSYLSTDGTMAANSDVKVPTEKAIVTYVAATAAPATAIDATDIADGSVTNTEFQYIGTLTSNAQTQISGISTAVSSAATVNPGHHHIVSAIDTTGTADALIGTYTPAVAALTDGMEVILVSAFANATTTPTFQYNALTAKTIVKGAATALVAGDIPTAGYSCHFRYRAATDKWQLLNPAITALAVGTAAGTVAAGDDARLGYVLAPTTAAQAVGTGDDPSFASGTTVATVFNVTGNTQSEVRMNETAGSFKSSLFVKEYINANQTSGNTITHANALPAGTLILSVTAKVYQLITSGDGGTSWALGDGVTVDRWGSGFAFAANTKTTIADYPVGTTGILYNKTVGDVVITMDSSKTFTNGRVLVEVVYFYPVFN